MKEAPFPRMHVSLYVSNLEATVAFYEKFFGQPATKVQPHYAKFLLAEPALIISFVENPERVQQNFGHMGIQVETIEQVEAWQARMVEFSFPVLEQKDVACCYALQDKFWVNDPDGVQWEIYLFREDANFNDPKYAEGGEAAACCVPAGAQAQAKPKEKMRWNHHTQTAEASCEPGAGCC